MARRTPPFLPLRERKTGSPGSALAFRNPLTSFQTEAGILTARVTSPFPSTVTWPPSEFGLQIPPAEAAQLAHAHAGGIEEGEDRPVPGIRLQAQDAVQIGFRQNALGQAAADCRQTEGAADIVGQVPGPVGEGQQRLDGGQRPVAARRRQFAERVRELLEIGQGHLQEGLAHPRQKVLDVGPVGPLGMPGPAMQPDFQQLGVGIGPGRFRQAGKNLRNRNFFGSFLSG